MLVLEDLYREAGLDKPCALTIGSFDGVHRGHQRILNKMKHLGPVCVVTFSNHPSHVLPGKEPVKLIFSKDLKLRYLEKYGADLVYCVEFTKKLASMEYDSFLEHMMRVCPFEHLILGEGAHLGRKRGGTPEKVRELGERMGFETLFLKKEEDAGIISSGAIRECILRGELGRARELLGHPICIEVNDGAVADSVCAPIRGSFFVNVGNRTRIEATFRNGFVEFSKVVGNGNLIVEFL